MDNRQLIFDYLVGAGMTIAGACGTEANLWAESGDRPENVEDRSGIPDARYVEMIRDPGYDFESDGGKHYGFGLAQWTAAPRKRALMAFAREEEMPIESMQLQLDFLCAEMRRNYPSVWELCCSTLDEGAAAEAVCRFYEIPANTEAQAHARAEIARARFNKFINGHGTAPIPQPQDEPDAPDEPFWPPRVLDLDMIGADVQALQALLLARGYNVGGVSGIFDNRTRNMVMAFQAESGLIADGIAGPVTWSAILRR